MLRRVRPLPFPTLAVLADALGGLPSPEVEGAAIEAAVLVCLHDDAVLLARRALHPEDPWSGHAALPGGRWEPGDTSLLETALREAREELGIDPLARDAEGFRWRTRAQIEEGRSWLWAEDGVILFKAEASAWTPEAVQLQQVWTDPAARGAGNGSRGLRDLFRLLLGRVPRVCLFVRAENEAAIGLYDKIGMEHVLDYRSVLL